jgi:hypothetical protein
MSERIRKLWEKAQQKAQQNLDLENGESWLFTHFNPKTKCNNPAPPLTQRHVPVGCRTKVLPRGANRGKASRATRQNFGQGGNRRYDITTMAKREAERKKREAERKKREAERKKREEAAMKEITQVLEQLFKHIDDKHRRSC